MSSTKNQDNPTPHSRANRVGFLSVAKIVFSGMVMIGKKETWETNGIGTRMTPGQIVVGAVIGGLVVVVLLQLIVRIAIGFR